jgi:hypothetical protein
MDALRLDALEVAEERAAVLQALYDGVDRIVGDSNEG